MKLAKKNLRKIFNTFGIEIQKYNPNSSQLGYFIKSLECNKVDLIVDIGANEGQFAEQIRSGKYTGRIVSIEPLKEAHKMLVKKAIKDKNWMIYPRCALGSSEQNIAINISQNSVSSSILEMHQTHLDSAPQSKYIGVDEIQMSTLDKLIPKIIGNSASIFLKIDTQGYEWEILDGGKGVLDLVKGVLMEVSFIELYNGQKLWKECIEKLEVLGFECWGFYPAFTDPKTGRAMQMDALFYKK